MSFRLGDLLFSGDNIYRDGCVGAIDAHHGSDIPAFIRSLERIRASDVEWLLPSHGPIFRKDNALLDQAIARLEHVSAHGRFRHLRDRLAAAGAVGRGTGRRTAAGLKPNQFAFDFCSPADLAFVLRSESANSDQRSSSGFLVASFHMSSL